MQTNFTAKQLEDPHVRESEKILRTCVHCGFCTATCPTYVLLGDELDSPRGRIYLMKEMLENDRPADAKTVKHIDRCLSCLSCMTTCPSGVHYMHLVDHARKHIEDTYRRPWDERLLREILALVLPYPNRFRASLAGASLGRPLAGVVGKVMGERWGAMMRLAPKGGPSWSSWADRPKVFPAAGRRRARVTMLNGCAQRALAPEINEATVRLLTRHGVEVAVTADQGCCGALVHHMGQEERALQAAKANVDAWLKVADQEGGLDAVIINASGCGTTVKDYGFMLREDEAYAEKAAKISGLTKDVTEFLDGLGLATPTRETGISVAYHSACSMQHGQQLKTQPKRLLQAAGYKVKEPAEGHLCCGSAGTYNIMQPEIAEKLKARKVLNLERTKPQAIATGNIGCITQIGTGTDIPVVHTVELLDYATGGPIPKKLEGVLSGKVAEAKELLAAE